MLAQNFKTAEDLGISERQKEALIKTLVLLETGKLMHAQAPFGKSTGEENAKFTGHFNMEHWLVGYNCGTVACIGGTAQLVGDLEPDELDDASAGNRRLYRLFYPQIDDWSIITPEEAACALRSYLTTGAARWDLAITP